MLVMVMNMARMMILMIGVMTTRARSMMVVQAAMMTVMMI